MAYLRQVTADLEVFLRFAGAGSARHQIEVPPREIVFVRHLAMPFFAKLDARDVLDTRTDDALISVVDNAYDDVLHKVDIAIVSIGKTDIDPLDLPVPVRQVEASLPDAMKPILKELEANHHEKELWTTLGWTAAQVALVFLPVIGQFGALARGASLAARLARGTAIASDGFGAAMPWLSMGADVAMTGVQAGDLVTRHQIADASTSRDGTMLGIGKPSDLEWAIQAATAILTAVGIRTSIKGVKDAARLKQLRAEAAALEEASVAHPSGSAIESPQATREGKPSVDEVQTAPRRGVKTSGELETHLLAEVEIDDELEHIAGHPEIVYERDGRRHAKLSEKHEWIEESEGIWCRHSDEIGKACRRIAGHEPEKLSLGKVEVNQESARRQVQMEHARILPHLGDDFSVVKVRAVGGDPDFKQNCFAFSMGVNEPLAPTREFKDPSIFTQLDRTLGKKYQFVRAGINDLKDFKPGTGFTPISDFDPGIPLEGKVVIYGKITEDSKNVYFRHIAVGQKDGSWLSRLARADQ